MTDIQIFEPEGRAIPYVVEGEGPVSLVLVQERGLAGDVLGVVAHYLAEEAGFHVLRLGHRSGGDVSLEEHASDAAAVIEHAGFTHSWIGGHGFGGTVARALTAQHPDRANGLLLLGVEESDLPIAPAIPVLIIQGTADEVTPPANGERLQQSLPERASITRIEGDHLFPMSHPIETAVVIEEYLDWD